MAYPVMKRDGVVKVNQQFKGWTSEQCLNVIDTGMKVPRGTARRLRRADWMAIRVAIDGKWEPSWQRFNKLQKEV